MSKRWIALCFVLVTWALLATACNSETTPTPFLGDTWVRPTDGMTMVYVPAGQFEMGDTEPDDVGDEWPAHTVTLDEFWIDRYEVTNAQFAAFLNELGNQTEGGGTWLDTDSYGNHCLIEQVGGEYQPKEGYADHPVIEVTWYGASAYCEWVGGRLPTEAEWEYAARGPEGYTYPWGNELPTCELANFIDCLGQTAPVDSFPDGASWCGAEDMAGNVWEWTNDWYDSDYYSRSPSENPPGPKSGIIKAMRGGSWVYVGKYFSAAIRFYSGPGSSSGNVGFRCVRFQED